MAMDKDLGLLTANRAITADPEYAALEPLEEQPSPRHGVRLRVSGFESRIVPKPETRNLELDQGEAHAAIGVALCLFRVAMQKPEPGGRHA